LLYINEWNDARCFSKESAEEKDCPNQEESTEKQEEESRDYNK
jgi:hypothetical protein